MQIVHTVLDLQNLLDRYKSDPKTIGFVPTMGALHEGHLSLVNESKKNNDVTVVSIFVNPTQFNDPSDLEKYPRTLDQDTNLLANAGVDIVFAPSVKDIYPEPDTRIFDFGQLDQVMEGKYRPNHFNGVAQVVSRLFDLVKPTRAYFGEKDFQQLAIIRSLVKQYNIPVEIVAVPIKRELSGLAMSSRNQRLTTEQLTHAANIYRVLNESLSDLFKYTVEQTIQSVVDQINTIDELDVEYLEIVDGYTLQPVLNWSDSDYIVGCITVYCGDVRLIDNIKYKG